jgi:hypothetical protein
MHRVVMPVTACPAWDPQQTHRFAYPTAYLSVDVNVPLTSLRHYDILIPKG